jgi:hypothetical protein
MTNVAAVVAAVLFLAMAGFQAAVAVGAPLGEHVLGGRFSGRLPGRLRVFSAIAALILAAAAVLVLARAGVIGSPEGVSGIVAALTWVIAGYMALNTLGNLRSRSRLERTLFAAITAALAVLCAYVALTAARP